MMKSENEHVDLYRVRRTPKKDDVTALNILLFVLAKKTKKKFGSRKMPNSFNPLSQKQFCVFKCTYGTKKNSHRIFLNYYMPQKNRAEVTEKPEVYGTDINEYKAHMDDRFFKFIISPESAEVDQKVLVNLLIKKLEVMTGYSFYWQAVKHTNTDQMHTHLLINGVDKRGRKIRFSRDLIKNQIRETLRDLCTNLVGKRTQEQIRNSKAKMYTAARWTTLDEVIFRNMNSSAIFTTNEKLLKRLKFLETLNIASRNPDESFVLEKNWNDSLTYLGRYNTFLKARSELKATVPSNMLLYQPEMGSVSGTVRKVINMDDEEIWNNALVIENTEKREAWYVPVYKPHSATLAGSRVTCSCEMNHHGKLTPKITEIDQKRKSLK